MRTLGGCLRTRRWFYHSLPECSGDGLGAQWLYWCYLDPASSVMATGWVQGGVHLVLPESF